MDESKFREFDPAEYLDSDEMIAGYLAEIMETGDVDRDIKEMRSVMKKVRKYIQGESINGTEY